MRLACWMAWVCVLLSGCGGATTAEQSAGGNGGAAGGGGAGGTSGAGGTAGAGGSDGPGCTRTTDRATIGVVASWNGAARDCGAVDMGSDATIALDGRLVAVTPDSFTVDECPLGGAPCSPELTTFSVAAPGLTLALPEGAFVHLKYRVHRFFACIKSLEVGTVASLYGVPNPAGPSGVLLLAITDGAAAAFDDSPYTIDRRALGCRPDAGPACGGGAVDEYAFVFAPTAAPEQTVEVGMGQTKPLDLHQGPFGAWNARNLRSFETGYCDDYWNYAYFIAWLPPVK